MPSVILVATGSEVQIAEPKVALLSLDREMRHTPAMSLLMETSAPAPRNVPDPPRFGLRQLVYLLVGVVSLGGLGWAIHDWFAARQTANSPAACEFLNASEVSAIVGAPVSPGVRDTPDDDYQHHNSICRFALPTKHSAMTLYVRMSGASQELQSHERGITDNRMAIQQPGVTGFSGSFQGSQWAFLTRHHHFFEVWTTPGSGTRSSVEKLALLASSGDHALNG